MLIKMKNEDECLFRAKVIDRKNIHSVEYNDSTIDCFGREICVGDIFTYSFNYGGKKKMVIIGEKIYYGMSLCVVHRISKKIYIISDGAIPISTNGGGLGEKIGKFKKDYDFDENFILTKTRGNND